MSAAWRAALVVSVLVVGCFSPPEDGTALFSAELVLRQGLMQSDLGSADVFILSGTTVGRSALSCNDLQQTPLLLRDDLDVRFHRLLSLTDSTLDPTLDKLAPGKSLIIAVDAYASADGTGPRIGFGCKESVSIVAGHATAVAIDIAPLTRQ